MDNNDFTVTSAKIDKIVSSLLLFLFCVPWLIISFLISTKIIMNVAAIIVFLIGIYYFLSSIMEYVSVKSNVLKGRTILGKKYEIQLDDIKKVVFLTRTSSGLRIYSITIYSDTVKIPLIHTMVNFEKMAELIRENFDNDERDINKFDDCSLSNMKEYFLSREKVNNKK